MLHVTAVWPYKSAKCTCLLYMPVIKAFAMQMLQELGNNIWDAITESANQKTQVPTPLYKMKKCQKYFK